MMDENQRAKREFITAFFDNAEARIAFLIELANTGHKSEAMTLCLTYIDSFSQWLRWPAPLSGRNFVEALIEFGGDPIMGLVHPLQAIRAFGAMKAPWQKLTEHISLAFPRPMYELLPFPSFEMTLARYLPAAELEQIRRELWRATVANVVYQHLRNPSIHSFGSSKEIMFSQTLYQGSSAPSLAFPQLLNCVRGLVGEARRRSENNGQWFGNDTIVKGV